MAELTRRGFLTRASVGAAAVGAMIVAPGMVDVEGVAAAQGTTLSKEELSGPIVAQIRNLKTGEISLMVGTREIVIHDRKLANRLMNAAR